MVSSKTIAKHAGVSQTTVSRVLNNSNLVTKETKDKVMKVIRELNYRPNSIARSLINRKTSSIALISGPLHNPFFVETTTSIVSYAKSKSYNVNVHFENLGDNMSVYQDVLNHSVDGIILSSILCDDPIFDELNTLDIPFVMFNRKHKKDGHFVEMDNVQAGKLATEHLIELNHSNIVWVGGSQKMTTFKGRFEGFKKTMISHGIPVTDENFTIIDTDRYSVFNAIASIMSRKNRPTAILAATDSIAIYVIDYLIQKKYKIPQDISIMGIDNVELSSHNSFRLSTVGITDENNLGRIGIETLIQIIEDNEGVVDDFMQKTIQTKLIVRGTTCKI